MSVLPRSCLTPQLLCDPSFHFLGRSETFERRITYLDDNITETEFEWPTEIHCGALVAVCILRRCTNVIYSTEDYVKFM
jgi:hypothetical protein